MNLQDIRSEIDKIDGEIARLYADRMALVREVAAQKAKRGIPIFDPSREEEILSSIGRVLPDDIKKYGEKLFAALFETAKEYQIEFLNSKGD